MFRTKGRPRNGRQGPDSRLGEEAGNVTKNQEQTAEESNLQRTLENFYACDRCSFFVAGYRVLHGMESIDQAAAACDGAWLELIWNRPTRLLLEKSYGGQLDVELFYYDGQCPRCQRRYVYDGGEAGIEAGAFRIEIKGRIPPD
jgi:hypothetical protein